MSKQAAYRYSSKLTKFFSENWRNADVLRGKVISDDPHLPTLDPPLHAALPVQRCFLSDVMNQWRFTMQ